MSSHRFYFWLLMVLLLLGGIWLVGWLILRVTGWPLFNGRPDYVVAAGWPRLDGRLALGQVTGVDVDSQGRVFVFARGKKVWDSDTIDPAIINDPTVYVFDGQTGELLDAWGEGRFVMPHGLSIDQEDTVWLTDVGLHQVYHFDSSGNLLFTLGEAGVPGQDAAHFNRPTDVAIRPDGSFYVADGYENSRVVQFDEQGRFLRQWGSPGASPGAFDVPHSLALDGQGRLFVADRGNARVQIFDADGRYLTSWQDKLRIGRPWAVRLDANGLVYIVDGGDQNAWLPDRARVLILSSEGEILGRFGSYGTRPGAFIWPHAVAVGPDGALYVAEVGSGRRVQKFVPGDYETSQVDILRDKTNE